MKKLSNIEEGRLGRNLQTSFSDKVRIEDNNNVGDFRPIDIGGPLLWADRNLEIGGRCQFCSNEFDEYWEIDGWRLPTCEDMRYMNYKGYHQTSGGFGSNPKGDITICYGIYRKGSKTLTLPYIKSEISGFNVYLMLDSKMSDYYKKLFNDGYTAFSISPNIGTGETMRIKPDKLVNVRLVKDKK